ncbi:transposase [Fusarium oxysporum f. sp. phaseoli]
MPSGNRSFGAEISGNRKFNHEFTPEQRAAIMAELHAGKSQREVADNFSTTQGTISKTKRRWEQHHNLASQPRKGRPKKLTPLQLIRINSYINRHREITWNDVLCELELDVSIRTLKRRLQSNWRRKWRSKRRIELSEEDAKARLEHCTFWLRHLYDYIRICFSDEVTVQNAPNNPDGWVFRRPDEKYRKDLVNVQSHGKACQSIMFWAGISGSKRTYIIPMMRDITSEKGGYSSWSYRKALTEGLLPFIDEFGDFQQDNARVHIAKASKDWLLLHGIIPIKWPAHSPDLNPIEHIWKALKAKLRRIHPEFIRLGKSEAHRKLLIKWIQEAWQALPDRLILKLTTSAANRLRACKRARGWYTEY